MTDVHLEFAMLFNQYPVLVLPRFLMSKELRSFLTPAHQEKICPVQCEQSDTPWMALEKNSIGEMEVYGNSQHTIPSGA